MATYPTLSTAHGSEPSPMTRQQIDRAEDGTGRVRNYGTDKMKFGLSHPSLSSADVATLDAFYVTNRLLSITYVSPSDSVSRTCIFASAPAYKFIGVGYYSATVMLEEV